MPPSQYQNQGPRFKISNSQNSALVNDINFNQLPEYSRHQALQIGDLKMSLHGSINGWLLCDGTSVSRRDFPELFITKITPKFH